MNKYGLILEGGGMRGVYTAGVLDVFLDNNIEFDSVYGVSAGSVNACNYLSKQRGRTIAINTDYVDNPEYAGWKNLFTTGNFFGTEMCYHTVPEKLNPYDYETFNKFKGNFYAVVTNCRTGQPEYIKITDMKNQIDVIRASCSLPMMAEMVKIKGGYYLDGGISDSIPIRKSVKDGNNKNVVILTRDITYRKKKNEMMIPIKMIYRHNPELIKTIEMRHINYNRRIEYILNQEQAGNVFVIRPKRPVEIGRLEKDKDKLFDLYNQGIEDGKREMERLKSFMEKNI